ncbi:MAG TPA: ribonuclease G [Burkholderiales bacterium]|nr:ribonuclease G [Burkholderiales bacterium]
MSEEILINVTPQETRVAVLAAGVVQELLIERTASRGLVGNVYVGRVARVLPGMQSAFIEIGLERAAFLHVADIWEHRRQGPANGAEAAKPIEKILAEGQPVMVQVVKDPIGSKGARLSTQVSIAGRMLVYLPQDPHIGISQRIEDESGRNLLREKLKELLPHDETGGFIIRTLAEGASDEELRADIDYLRHLWRDIRTQALGAQPPKLLYQDLSLAQRVLRDMVTDSTEHVVVDSRENHQKLIAFAETYTPRMRGRIEHYVGERPLFDLYNVEPEIERALSRRVELKSGGYLIIDQTEAMTTVDVNTGGFVGQRNFDDTIFKTNLEAAQAIARQLRLRNLGGIIIIDFIDMTDEEHKRQVLRMLEKALAHDHAKTTVYEMSHLGLVEMTRKRTVESLERQLCEACPACDGRGSVKTAETVTYEIFREITRAVRQFDAAKLLVLAAPKVVGRILDEESAAVAELEEFTGKTIRFQAEEHYAQEQYDVVLL